MLGYGRGARISELFRYYQAGMLNTVFGLSLYSLLVWLGLHVYAAQLLSHIIGIFFNYVTYRRHVFKDSNPVKAKFVVSYITNYFMGLASLSILLIFLGPYSAGIFSVLIVSILNYFLLKFLVFSSVSR